MRLETAGDPITGLRWTHKATEKIAKELRRLGIHVGRSTVGRLLKELNFSLRVNHKKRSNGSPATRDQQFRYIRGMRTRFAKRGDPICPASTIPAGARQLFLPVPVRGSASHGDRVAGGDGDQGSRPRVLLPGRFRGDDGTKGGGAERLTP